MKNKPDATLRNTQAANKRFAELKAKVKELAARLKKLEDIVQDALER